MYFIISNLFLFFRLIPSLVENELDKVDKIKIRRSCIPSKDNPPEEMMEWLKTFTVCKIVALVKFVSRFS